MKKLGTILLLMIGLIVKSQPFFTVPKMTFINKSSENITDLSFNSALISDVQIAINNARNTSPNNIIRITLTGNYNITNSPIQLSDKMLLFFKNATVQAATTTTASSFVSIINASYVSINAIDSCVFDGLNKNIKGFEIINSSKVHIDKITIKNCYSGAVSYIGKGAAVYADAGSITRCKIQNCKAFGIYYNNSFNFICTDNQVTNSDIGIASYSNNSVLANNTIINCLTGVSLNGLLNSVSYNSITNNSTAIDINGLESEALISNNSIKNNTLAFNVACTKARIYYNTCAANNTIMAGNGNSNQFICNSGIASTDMVSSLGTFFNPPTIGNQHTDLIKVGKSRQDINLNSGSISSIRSALDAAHTSFPTSVIVARLNGTYTTSGISDSLLVKEDECILLNGTIRNGSGESQTAVYFKDNNIYASFSGGTIDGSNGVNGKNALIYVTGSSNVVLDSINVKKSGGEGITKRNSTSPTFIRACKVDSSSSRGIWQLASSRLFAIENIVTNSQQYDGLDLDAFSQTAVLLKNTASGNKRYGVFIEEGATNHILLGNTLNSNNRGVSFYNMNVAGKNTSKNLIASNICRLNQRGIHIDALLKDRATTDNVIFNNICENNSDVGIGGFYKDTTSNNNYCALNTIQNNTTGIFSVGANLDSNYVWNMLASANALPAQIIDFSGFVTNFGNKISWKANCCFDVETFEIQRSTNGIDFITVAFTTFNSIIVNYSFLDKNITSGKNYYRLKLLDTYGKSIYSKTIVLDNSKVEMLEFNCQQINSNSFQIVVRNSKPIAHLDLKIFDLTGKICYSNSYKTNNTKAFSTIISLPNLSSATYLFQAVTEGGTLSKKIKIIQ